MKIGILTQYYPPESGAPQARLSELASRMVKKGHEVVVLTGMPNYPKGKIFSGYRGVYKREVIDGVVVKRVPLFATHRSGFLPRMTNYLSFVVSSAVIGAFTLPRLDYLLTESPPLFLGVSGYLLSRLKGARWIFNVSDLWPSSAVELGVVKKGLSLDVAWKLEAWCYAKADLVSGQSREILENIRDRFPDVRTIPLSNGVDVERFTPERRSVALHDRLSGQRSYLALYAGLHGRAQGLEQVLYAAQKLGPDADVTILLVGDGPEKPALRRLKRKLGVKNVRFVAGISREDIPQWLAAADIALVTLKSRLTGAVPSKLYEAMASGVAVVLAANGEPAEIVRTEKAGVVVKPGDGEALADKIAELMRNSESRKQMGAQGRMAAERRFNRETIVNEFVGYLEKSL